jgi:TPR repeat protein
MYYNGKGVKPDYSIAAKLFAKACDMGGDKGCCNLGFMYEKGIGVEQNSSKAKAFYSKACDMGNKEGCVGYEFFKRSEL